ncbi:hypothetical protein [Parasitella parasitica]|uniref:Uncharacterized protein n=1 Tax=Parasitella parasitica TaxID=35722 RepID=A0A0B7NKI9_9FUNG|nr:hypothetical protein [Parasitella parasitica]
MQYLPPQMGQACYNILYLRFREHARLDRPVNFHIGMLSQQLPLLQSSELEDNTDFESDNDLMEFDITLSRPLTELDL